MELSEIALHKINSRPVKYIGMLLSKVSACKRVCISMITDSNIPHRLYSGWSYINAYKEARLNTDELTS